MKSQKNALLGEGVSSPARKSSLEVTTVIRTSIVKNKARFISDQ